MISPDISIDFTRRVLVTKILNRLAKYRTLTSLARRNGALCINEMEGGYY